MEFGVYPFWFLNDRLTEAEVCWQIEEMAAQGVRGFFLHSRQGLGQPYMSESFFRMVDVAVQAAEEHGLIVHLYDEYPYPSGIAGGEVVLGNPEFYATALTQRAYDVEGGKSIWQPLPKGKVLACWAQPIGLDGLLDWTQAGIDLRTNIGVHLAEESYVETGLTAYNRKRYFASEPTPTLDTILPGVGKYRIFASVQTVVEGHKYWGHFVDILNPEAVAAFLNATHERYAARYGELFGTRIVSIFVDEVESGWSARIPGAFRQAYGYDLLTFLPALQDRSHPEHLRVAHDLHQLKYRLFCETFDGPVADWCAAHNIRYSGEKPSLRLSQLRFMDIPGCDAGHTKAGAKSDLLGVHIRSSARAAASAAYFYDKSSGSLCECYHSLGWAATLQDAKFIAEGLLLHGVSMMVPHGFFYSTHALKKHDAPPSFFFQMPYWPKFGYLTQRIERIGKGLLEGTWTDAQILVVEPTSGLPTAEDRRVFESLQFSLMENHLDFLLADTDILQSGTIADDGSLQIRDLSVRAIVVPPMRVIETPLADWLSEYEKRGGLVIRTSDPTTCIASLNTAAILPHLRVTPENAEEVRQVQVTTRFDGKCHRWLLLHTGKEAITVTLASESGKGLKEIPLDETLPLLLAQTESGYTRRLAAFESVLLEEIDVPELLLAAPGIVPMALPSDAVFSLKPLQRNLLRLADWELTLLDGNGNPVGGSAVVAAAPLPNQLKQGNFAFAPTTDLFFGASPRFRMPELRARYSFTFENRYEDSVELVMEPGSLNGEWSLCINDGTPLHASDFVPTETHIRGSLGADITPFLRPGTNALTVEVTTDHVDGGLRNPLYLAGDFGVSLEPLALTPPITEGVFDSWEANGFPFYAGVLEYEGTVNLADLPEGDSLLAEMVFPIPFESACEVAFGDRGEWHPLLWSPYRTTLPEGELISGENRIRLRVYTALERVFEGQRFDIPSHKYVLVTEKT